MAAFAEPWVLVELVQALYEKYPNFLMSTVLQSHKTANRDGCGEDIGNKYQVIINRNCLVSTSLSPPNLAL
ncbi:Serine palmitoyltransferase 1 [Manis javanica]|nr:Serine palmitoyltransferase 1 [Manis javanica]